MKKAFSKKNLWEIMPPVFKKIIASTLLFVPLEYLIGAKFRQERKLIASANKWTKEEIDAYHLKKLQSQVQVAYDKCPAYKKLYDDAKIDVFSFTQLSDFKKFPFIDKSFINNNIEALCMRDKNSAGVDYVTTGGTSGIPLTFYINASRSQIEYAYLVDGWSRTGFKLGDIKAVLRGTVTGENQKKNQSYDPIFNEYYYSSFHMNEKNMREYILHLKSLKNCFLHVYPSSIYQLARFAKKENIKFTNIKAVLAESENIEPDQRELVEEVFDCHYYSSYGHSEKLVAAGECEFSHDYHVWPTYGYLELIDKQGDIITKKGEVGEIVGTGFINTVMPFIRYRTGDFAEFVGSHCEKCNRNHLMIRKIRGNKAQEYLIAEDRSLIPWTAINMHDDTFDEVLQYQLYQYTPGKAIIKIIGNHSFDKAKEKLIIKNIGLKLKGRIEVSVLVVDSLKKTKRGKSIFVDQHIKLSSLD